MNQLTRSFEIIDSHRNQCLFMHCAANERASISVVLYHIARVEWHDEESAARADTAGIPKGWETLTEDVLRESHR